MIVDLFFNYKYNVRFFLLNKFFYKNLYEIDNIKGAVFFFSIKEYDNLDSKEIYNFFYLFKFFFGKLAFFSSYVSLLSLGKWYYNFDVKVIINKKFFYYYMYFIFNDFLFNLSKDSYSINLNKDFYLISIPDMSIFNDKKSNLGLFNLNSTINFKFLINKNNAFIENFIFSKLNVV